MRLYFKNWLEDANMAAPIFGGIKARMIEKALKNPSKKIEITKTEGLSPLSKKVVSPFFWKGDNNKKPAMIRWMWNPLSGEMRLSATGQMHSSYVKKDEKFDHWVRGFYFPEKKHIVIRPYAPFGPYEYDSEISNRMLDYIGNLLKLNMELTDPSPSKPIRVIKEIYGETVNNKTLESKYGKYNRHW